MAKGINIAATVRYVDDVHTKLLLEANSFEDSSPNNQYITNQDVELSSVRSKFGKTSFYFNGNSRLLFPQTTILWGANDFTVEWWEYSEESTNKTRFCSAYSVNDYLGMLLGYAGTSVYISSSNTAGTANWDLVSGPVMFSVTPNEWVHWAVVRNGTLLNTYRNGTLFAQTNINGAIGNCMTYQMALGDYRTGDPSPFKGWIDEFRISDIARWTSDFTPPTEPYSEQNHTENVDVPTQQFDNTLLLLNGETILDYTNKNKIENHGVQVSSAQSKFGGKSLYFSAVDSYLKTTDFQFGSGDFTVEWWEYPTGGTVGTRWSTSEDNAALCGGIAAGGPGGLSCLWVTRNSGWDMFSQVQAFSSDYDTWTHWALVRHGDTWMSFKNGTLFWSATGTGSVFNSGSGFIIGTFLVTTQHQQFYGYMDEFRVSNIARYTENFEVQTESYTKHTLTEASYPRKVKDAWISVGKQCEDDENTLLLLEANDFEDYSLNDLKVVNHGAVVSSTQSKFGGKSFYFNGNACLEVDLPVSGDCTIDFWINQEGYSPSPSLGYDTPFHLNITNNEQDQDRGLYMHYSAQVNSMAEGMNNNVVNISPITHGTWNHIAMVRSSGVIKLYVNGVFNAQIASDGRSTKSVILGSFSNTLRYNFKGWIDEFRVSSIARWTSDFTPPAESYSKLNPTNKQFVKHIKKAWMGVPHKEYSYLLLDGNTLTDTSKVGQTIENHGVQLSTAQSKFGGSSLYFDGASYLSLPELQYPKGQGDFTIEYWEYRTVGASGGATFHINASAGSGLGFLLGYGDNVNAFAYMTNASGWDMASGVVMNTQLINQWCHIAVVRSGNNFYFFENGTLKNSFASDKTILMTQTPKIGIYDYSGGISYYTGYLDEFCISNIAKWTTNFTPPTKSYSEYTDADCVARLVYEFTPPNPASSVGADYTIRTNSII